MMVCILHQESLNHKTKLCSSVTPLLICPFVYIGYHEELNMQKDYVIGGYQNEVLEILM